MFSATLFLWAVPRKKSATRWLMFSFFFLSLFNLAYALPASIYHTNLAFHRWATGTFVMLGIYCMTQFFLRWHKPFSNKVLWGFLIVQGLVILIQSADFIIHISATPVRYNFRSMLWDFSDFEASKRFGIILILNLVLIFAIGYWKAFTLRGKRLAAFSMTTGFIIGTLVPGIVNVLSRDGLFSRDIYQITLDTTYIFGFFWFLIIFINVATESVTFMARIVAISMALFLLVMTPVSYVSLDALASAWQADKRKQSELVLIHKLRPPELRYIAWLPAANANNAVQPKFSYQSAGHPVNLKTMRREMQQSLERHLLIQQMTQVGSSNKTALLELIDNHTNSAPLSQKAWLAALKSVIQQSPSESKNDNIQSYFQRLDQIGNRVSYSRTKASQLPEEDYKTKVMAILKSQGKNKTSQAFMQAALEHVRSSNAKPNQIKSEVLELLSPFPAIHHEISRYNTGTGSTRDHFRAFHIVDTNNAGVYEVAYSYLAYRQYLHEVAINLLAILLGVTFIILVVFKLFFLGSLIRPLERLVEGVSKVNEGQLDVEIPVHVKDEIGFLTRSFNGMVESIRTARQKLQDYAEQLEDKVKIRTAELQNTLETVQDLKKQQDGDYFLTALLARPLGRNQVKNPQVSIDFVVIQKKQFAFRNKKDEIGGDLCKAHDIQLKDRDYVVFLNADAMGKSIQGAGGVLVLGSVFESMINRTQSSQIAQQIYPERWLKNAFSELHKVFESFDGSMLISLVLGLIDTKTGYLYYMNAEHPASVLYRNHEASFIDEDMMFRKLGTQGMDGKLHIQCLQMEAGDVLIAGSDGRDDILLGTDAEGRRQINEDEYLFLDIVREADGDIQRMPAAFKSHGELTDDLSLLKLQYHGNQSETLVIHEQFLHLRQQIHEAIQKQEKERALELLKDVEPEQISDSSSLREIALFFNHLGQYERACQFAHKYVNQEPADVEMIYRASIMLKRVRSLELAADLAERIRLRQPGNIRNLIHLADIYVSLKNIRRALKIIHLVLAQEPENQKAQKVMQYIQSLSEPSQNT